MHAWDRRGGVQPGRRIFATRWILQQNINVGEKAPLQTGPAASCTMVQDMRSPAAEHNVVERHTRAFPLAKCRMGYIQVQAINNS